MIIKIKDIEDECVDVYRNLRERELSHIYEPDPGLFIVESPKIIERALTAGYQPVSVLMDEKMNDEHLALLARLKNIPVYVTSYKELTKLTGYTLTKGAMCLMQRQKLLSLEELLQNAKRIAVMDNVENPTNVGAIMRSAAAMNMDGVILTNGCADPLYRRASRVSMGTVFQIKWTIVHTGLYEKLHDYQFKIAGLALKDDAIDIRNKQLNQEEKLAVVLGNEGDGLSDESLQAMDYKVIIPMHHGVDSLNVAGASAVAFYQLAHHE